MKFYILSFLFFLSYQVKAILITWDDPDTGEGLHITHTIKHEKGDVLVREPNLNDLDEYVSLFQDSNIARYRRDGIPGSKEIIRQHFQEQLNLFKAGKPGRLILIRDEKLIGSIELWPNGEPGTGEVLRALHPSVQGQKLGTATLKFLVETWAPQLQELGLSSNPAISVNFQCFGTNPLNQIYGKVRPNNTPSWRSYRYFNFFPSPPHKEDMISCEDWEASQCDLESYLMSKYFGPTAIKRLLPNTLYSMIDPWGENRTLSYNPDYRAPEYHFVRSLTALRS